MAWIESHQELGRHPKTRKAARRLGIAVPQMVGHLHLLWHWALDYADTGELNGHDDEDVALGAMWEGDPEQFVQVLTDVGFIDPDRTLHDWMDYAGRLVRDRIRKREERAASNGPQSTDVHGQSTDSPTTDVQKSTDRARARTQPNPTQPSSKPLSVPDATDDEFEAFWNSYPRHHDTKATGGGGVKHEAKKAWSKLTDAQRSEAVAALDTYAKVCRPYGQKPKHAERFLRNDAWKPYLPDARDGPRGNPCPQCDRDLDKPDHDELCDIWAGKAVV